MNQCLVCTTATNEYLVGGPPEEARVQCEICGTYILGTPFAQMFLPGPPPNNYVISGAIRENHEAGILVKLDRIDWLLDSVRVPKTLPEKIDKLLLHLARKQQFTDQGVLINEDLDFPLVYARDYHEFHHILVLTQVNGILDSLNRLTLKAWERLEELRRDDVDNNQAFVAMWFDREMWLPWDRAFKPALDHTGYKAMRIDRTEHNDKIDDRIIAEIRKSGLLIADFTGDRGGVYYEAGFAKGLGKNVIWTCREDWFEKVHFDTRQFNHIVWTDPIELEKMLINRIEATFPLGREAQKRGRR